VPALKAAQALARDLERAQRLQRSFLPTLPATLGGCAIAAEYRPAFAVGGDFYDVHASGPGRLTAIIGDVAGKGVAGALLMSRVSAEIRRLDVGARAPSAVLEQLNAAFAQLSDESFFTAACVQLEVAAGYLQLANAGHVLPLLRRASGAVLPLGRASGPPVGMLAAPGYGDERFAVAVGDIVLLMTDGVLEALHGDDDQLGMWTLLDLVARAPRDVAEINRRILAAVAQRVGAALDDDVTLLSIELR
jgi:serine phosphatase RsbU (regulator of sigma subunit)